jgi:hypothetical protein
VLPQVGGHLLPLACQREQDHAVERIELGGATLNFDSLVQNAAQIKGWGQALAPGADLLIYGCDVAQLADGKALVDALSRLTGANVAASEDLTGAADKGGNWTLEYDTGHISTALAISATEQATWDGVLQGYTVGGEALVNTTTAGTQQTGPALNAKSVAIAPDGSPVEMYLLIPVGEEPDVVRKAVSPAADILELGCGVGRVTHALVELGYRVVAVDESPEMLAHVVGAERLSVHASRISTFPVPPIMTSLSPAES